MTSEVLLYDDPKAVVDVAELFLAADPILNNLVLTLLPARIAHPEPGRYWIAFESHQVVGVAFQSPLDRPAILSAMSAEVASHMGNAIGAERHELPGVYGEARLAARFAGDWAERRKVGVVPADGHRIYAARAVRDGPTVPGTIQRATPAHYTLVRDWASAFSTEVGEPAESASQLAERAIAAKEIWLWNDGGFRSIARLRPSAHAVVGVSLVYTPPEHRRMGYAEALVRALTHRSLDEGLRPMLFAALANPISNGLYRRIGYEAVAEVVRFRFATESLPHF